MSRIQLRAAGLSAEGGTLDILVYTGGIMTPSQPPVPLVIDLAALEVPDKRTAILYDHAEAVGYADAGDVVNDGRSVRISGHRLDNKRANELALNARQGFPYQASIGVDIVDSRPVPTGETVKVNGRMLAGPFLLVTRSRYSESSVVIQGADSNTFSIAAKQGGQMEEKKDVQAGDMSPLTERKDAECADPLPEKKDAVTAAAPDLSAVAELVQKYPANAKDIVEMAAAGKGADEIESALEEAAANEQAEALAAAKAENEALRAELAKVNKVQPVVLTRPIAARKPAADTEPTTEAEFRASPLSAEFRTLQALQAYQRNLKAGRIKVRA